MQYKPRSSIPSSSFPPDAEIFPEYMKDATQPMTAPPNEQTVLFHYRSKVWGQEDLSLKEMYTYLFIWCIKLIKNISKD